MKKIIVMSLIISCIPLLGSATENNVEVIEETEEIIYDNKEIDITHIVFSGARGVSMGIEYKCHKDECKDFSYSTKNKVDKYGNVILTIEPIGLNKWQMLYDATVDIAGFQFNVEGAELISAEGGDADINKFTTSAGGDTVLSFSFKGDVIPAGKGILVIFEVK